MSDAKAENKGSAPSGVSGRMLSRARRQAMSQSGKASLGQMRKAVPTAAPVRVESVVPPELPEEPSRDDDHGASNCGCMQASEQKMLDAVCDLVEAEPTTLGTISSSVRRLCQERRRALSSQGKAAVKSAGLNAVSTRHGSINNKAVAIVGSSGRAAARARREAMCENGRGNDPACRPSGRVRSRVAPVKVEIGTTLSGNLVTGTQVERSSKVTGVESGSCREITGTEYIGAEQYGKLCVSTPPAAPAKVSVSTTSRNQRVSGVELGRSDKVTGDEHGACNGKLTGSQYVQNPSGSLCQGSGVPHKVSVMSTVRERPVTGTDVAVSASVTGGEYGACSSVTGTGYVGLQQYQACNREPVLTPEKVGVMRTWRDQPVSGTMMEHNPKVTGAEYGGCQPISGTEYMGPDQYTAFCDEERQAASRALMASRGARAGVAPSGTRVESGSKVTGVERGESRVLSGTPYSGPHQRVSQRGANSNPHPLTRGPANAPRAVVSEESQAPAVQGIFSIVTPARRAQDSSLSRITGTASGAQGRITGPVNLAAGLVSGTPEFRYRDDAYGAAPIAMEQLQAPEGQRSRLTGDGREGGFAITGAAWRRNESITGTEGTSAARRNPTLRGNQRSMAMQVLALKDREHLQVAPSKVTGSSGSADTGSTITYSGGARG
ncbi:CsoS2 family carboxysome shell protein [Ferrovum sp.]|uniref:CsoS2 family carboxysome shell protein n=1 Tax=Ferrovum sp. TaxID=2609467 RepID=UPI0026036F86|nr:CsoS2 family carboxysome shell protein [Ferrovum sp.]